MGITKVVTDGGTYFRCIDYSDVIYFIIELKKNWVGGYDVDIIKMRSIFTTNELCNIARAILEASQYKEENERKSFER